MSTPARADPTDEIELSGKDRFIAKLVSFLARAVYRDIQVHWATPPPANEPTLSVSNHFGGFADALVLLHSFPRRPGIIARDVIWKIPVVGWLMTWIGGIPVHKPEDGATASANDQMFGSCYRSLEDGGHLLIFPEGVTRNEPSIARVKTGAARIALGARAAGAQGLVIAPVGIHYEDKAALRSRVVVNAGVPIELDAIAGDLTAERPLDADNRDAVDALTAEIDVHLRRVAPDYVDWQEARDLTAAAEVALRSHQDDRTQPVPIGLRDRLANVLADRPADNRSDIREAITDYKAALDGVGMTDAQLGSEVSAGGLLWRLVTQVLIGLILLPFAVVGAVINLVPYLLVKAAGALRLAPSMLSTIKPLVAFVSFGVAWGLVIWWAGRQLDIAGAAAAFVLMPVYAIAVLLLAERVVLGWRMVRGWSARRRRGSVGQRLAADRAGVERAVWLVP